MAGYYTLPADRKSRRKTAIKRAATQGCCKIRFCKRPAKWRCSGCRQIYCGIHGPNTLYQTGICEKKNYLGVHDLVPLPGARVRRTSAE